MVVEEEYTPSAVLIPIFYKDGEPHLLLTLRTETRRIAQGANIVSRWHTRRMRRQSARYRAA